MMPNDEGEQGDESNQKEPARTSQREEERATHPGINDVRFGRGGGTNYHIGNARFRFLAGGFAEEFATAERRERSIIVERIIREWRNQEPPGRFLAQTDDWHEVGDEVASKKTFKVLWEAVRTRRKNARASRTNIMQNNNNSTQFASHQVGISDASDAVSHPAMNQAMTMPTIDAEQNAQRSQPIGGDAGSTQANANRFDYASSQVPPTLLSHINQDPTFLPNAASLTSVFNSSGSDEAPENDSDKS